MFAAIGAIIIASVLNIIAISGAAEWLQLVVKGVIIAVAVAVQTTQWGRRGG